MTDDISTLHPPLRKKSSQVKTVALKQILVEQHSKLQHKHQQHDNDILEDICNFAKRRAQIEKDYAQALLKLSNGLLSRKDPFQIPELEENGKEFKTVASVWHTVLEETEKIAKVRLMAAETYMQEVSEPIRALKAHKNQHMKKLLDQLATIQSEVTQSVRELNKAKKIYTDEEKLAHDARQKSSEAEEKVKRRSTGLFSSLASLQKTSAKLTSRKEACETKSTGARNEYLLGLGATNAHLLRFYSMDLPELMRAMDGDMYEKVQQAFMALSKTELECCGLTQECFSKVLCDSTMISRDYNHKCLLNHNSVFIDMVQYSFELYEGDPTTKVADDPKCDHTLSQEAKKWAGKVAKENKVIQEYGRVLQSLITGTYTGEKKVVDPTSPEAEGKDVKQPEVEMTVDSCKDFIRKAETAKLKAEARLDLIREAGIDVDDMLTRASLDTLSPNDVEDMDGGRISVGDVSQRTASHSEGSPNGVTAYPSYNYDEDFSDEAFDHSTSSPAYDSPGPASASSAASRNRTSSANVTGTLAVALYDFQGSSADELNIVTNEYVTVVGPGDAPGWVKAVNCDGKEGLVPEGYIHMLDDNAVQTNESSTDVNGDVWGDSNASAGFGQQTFTFPETSFQPDVSSFPAPSFPPPEASPAVPIHDLNTAPAPAADKFASSHSSTDYEVERAMNQRSEQHVEWVRAVYDYEASAPEELSFEEGQLIRLISRDDEAEDGWWKGEIDGKVGVFPSLVVEELSDRLESDELTSPMRPGPPSFAPPDAPDGGSTQPSPPPVTVTLPTPSEDKGTAFASTENAASAGGSSDGTGAQRPNELADLAETDQIDSVSPPSPSSPLSDESASKAVQRGHRDSLDPGAAAVDLSTIAEVRVIANNEARRKSADGENVAVPAEAAAAGAGAAEAGAEDMVDLK